MLKLGRVTKVKVLFLLLVFVLNFDLFKFSAAILEKGLLCTKIDGKDMRFTAFNNMHKLLLKINVTKQAKSNEITKALLGVQNISFQVTSHQRRYLIAQ